MARAATKKLDSVKNTTCLVIRFGLFQKTSLPCAATALYLPRHTYPFMTMTTSRALTAALALGLLSACNGKLQQADKKFREEAAYNEAAELYKQALGETKDGKKAAEINAKIAESYRMSNRPAMALPYYKAAMDAGNKTDSLKYYQAVSMKDAGDIEGAKTAFAEYATAGRRQKWMERAKMEQKNLGMMPMLAGKGAEYEVMNVDAINTPSSEYSPVLVSNGDEMAFTASRSSKIYKQNGLPFTDIYHVKVSDLGAGAPVQPVAYDKFNTDDLHEASITFSKDGKMAIFARSNDGSRKGATDVDLYMSRMDKDGNWSSPEMLSISSANAWDASPTLSPDGKSLYFASNREGGKGGIDLYRSTLDANGRWGKVTNLGTDINTAGDEMFPDVTEDGKLFFSSDGQPGFGGLDLFSATRDKDKGTTVENLGQPINSKGDDFAITFKNAYEGYFTSNREGGKGDDDIYYFKNTLLEPKVVRLSIAGSVTGKAKGVEEGPLVGAKVHLMEDGKSAGESTTDDAGKFTLPVGEDKNYTVLIEKDGYFTKRDAVSTAGKVPPRKELKKENDIAVPYNNSLEKVIKNAVIVVENILYDYNKSDIRPDAAIELDKVVQMLNDNPSITIELSSHTDSRGDDKYNQKLSQARAEAAVKYIEGKGIADARITAKGYGKTRPIIKNATTEEEFQTNRRTEFKVTKIAQ